MATKNCRQEPSETRHLVETEAADDWAMYTRGTQPACLLIFLFSKETL